MVVFTGGTIGCSPPDSKAVLNTGALSGDTENWKNYYLLTAFKERSRSPYKDGVIFDAIAPLNTLSENMTVAKWSELAKALRKLDYSLYDGIIITHGTDTLAYTASFLGILLSGITLPVVLVSANKNLYDSATNGHQNFNAALDFILTSGCAGVYAAYSYDKEKTMIYLSTRIKQSQPCVDRFESMGGTDFGFVRDGKFTNTGGFMPQPYSGETLLNARCDFKPYVMLIHPYAGLDYSLIRLDKNKTRLVLHTLYHSFTACTEGESSSILYLNEMCKEKDIPLYAAPFSKAILDGGARYQSTELLINSGINFLCAHTLECAYAKLLIAANLYEDAQSIKNFVSKTIFYEEAFAK